ncbi:putative glycosyltransferase [Cotonvirus japonicus]|uniref:Glycosyltransferase n=1 Tax=Cotonvirus japonicus TaxID=2811091 RepID=A0ABM7NSE3_9VIRU|nr:putative glycosyltransferase [Cotonvirus japonicus]BCS83017.1 putative glycosyltransferase [Cotonvirus japonicus]
MNIINTEKFKTLAHNKKFINDREWILFIYVNSIGNDINIEKFYYKKMIEDLKRKLNIKTINIYACNKILAKILSDIIITPILIIPQNELEILIIFKNFIDQKNNILFFCNKTGYFDNNINNDNEFNSNNIYGIYKKNNDDIYTKILKNFNIDNVISTDILIIPFSEINNLYINNSLEFYDKINSDNKIFKTEISLTITNQKMNFLVNNINNNNFIKNFNDVRFTKNLKEQYIISNNNYDVNVPELFPNTNEYIFYPYFDSTSCINNNIQYKNQNNQSNQINQNNTRGIITAYNSNGFLSADKQIFKHVFKRFDNYYHGLYVKNFNDKNIIPKIIHHLWLDNEPSQNYVKLWKSYLKCPWKYMIWQKSDVDNIFEKNDWKIIYDHVSDKNLKQLVISLAILEIYGGLIIDSFCIPKKSIDMLLKNKFFMSYSNEHCSTLLSYKILGSLPGYLKINGKNFTDPNIGRKPFIGVNNFFKLSNHEINEYDDIIIPEFFSDMKNILLKTNDQSKLKNLDSYFLEHDYVFVYPSYLFNSNVSIYPSVITDMCLLLILTQSKEIKIKNKTKLNRSYIVTQESIINKLNENPRDKIKNINLKRIC